MRLWARLRQAKACGGCGQLIAKGAPALELAGPGWRVLRCALCAGEAVPEDIAEQPSQAAVIRGQFGNTIQSVKGLAADFKHSQAGER